MPSWCSGTILVGGFFCWKTLTFSLYKHYTVAALKYSPVHILKIICIIAADKNPTMHSRVCKYNTCLCDILNGEFGFSSLSCDSSDGSGQMVSLQRFNCWHTHTHKSVNTPGDDFLVAKSETWRRAAEKPYHLWRQNFLGKARLIWWELGHPGNRRRHCYVTHVTRRFWY